MTIKIICDIYCSSADSEMYLYVIKADGLSRVPEKLLQKFGRPRHVTTLLLHAGRKLARADVGKVIEQLQENGFYLQLPPPKDPEMGEIHQRNAKINL